MTKDKSIFTPMASYTVRPLPGAGDGAALMPEVPRELLARREAYLRAAEAPSVTDPVAAKRLIDLLDATAARAEAIGPPPLLLAECPHKYNDAWYDDLWYAVKAGGTRWQQSQYFEETSPPQITEGARFETELDGAALREAGAELASERIAALRAELSALQKADWRGAIGAAIAPERDLLALVVERGQRWLVLETPNDFDAAIFAWDADGLFPVGTMSRLDHAVGGPILLTFVTVDPAALPRLAPEARAYFHPSAVDGEAALRLAELAWEAAGNVREVTDEPAALLSRTSRRTYHDGFLGHRQPESFAEGLRPREGELRRPTNGVWPSYSPTLKRAEDSPLSDLAIGLHTALGRLEEAKWREVFAAAYGETLIDGQTLALFVGPRRAVLMRDNAAFRVTAHGLEPMAVFPFPDARRPAEAAVLADADADGR